ncbi:MAG: hypothetical protein Q7U45_14430, partial [Burkholderiaceae bacterium]|nr:hypothetical protein [Burkholderiaceae bacterium]
MKLYSYVLTSDTGFAPNPFDKYCSLACCKPRIRKSAKVGDWIVGTGSTSNAGNDHLIYVMKVTEKKDFNNYFSDKRFRNRVDNIYYLENDEWKQKENPYHTEKDIEHDLSGEYVLISDNFFYFGKKAVKIPLDFLEIVKKGPGHKSNFNNDLIENFVM